MIRNSKFEIRNSITWQSDLDYALGALFVEFHPVFRVDELAEGEARMVQVADKLIAIFRHEGQYFAIDDTCPHMGDSLSQGYVEKGIVTCPWHAWRFRLSDGAWADNPRIKIGNYPVRVVDDVIQVQV
jgi:nitrite reductase (NADH) small subunit/3-phenylpropionate/trans-cinnamate dioxygenase ferredoxin subunit